MRRLRFALVSLLIGSPALADETSDCDDWEKRLLSAWLWCSGRRDHPEQHLSEPTHALCCVTENFLEAAPCRFSRSGSLA
jgi:hypothetical protein